jgi:lipid-A-disaccharide synthase
VGKTPEIIELAECCLMVSGSVSLELLARKTPAVVTYRIGPLMRLLSFILLRCKYVTLPNLFADRELMPEFVYTGSPASSIRQVTNVFRVWLGDRQQLAEKTAELTELRERYFQTGATGRTAEAILKRLPPAEQRHAA